MTWKPVLHLCEDVMLATLRLLEVLGRNHSGEELVGGQRACLGLYRTSPAARLAAWH